MTKPIEIIISADNNYAVQCATTMASVLVNTNSKINFHILDGNINQQNKEKILKFEKQYDCKINFYDMAKLDFSEFPLNRDWISIATYYRLFILDILPQTISKALYLDCDIIVEKDIKELWDYDVTNYAAAVCEDDNSVRHTARLDLSKSHVYFNAGVLVLNLDKLREMSFKEVAFKYFKDNAYRITMQDQDILNGILEDKCLILPKRFNADTTLFRKIEYSINNYSEIDRYEAKRSPVIIHYTGGNKPWLSYCMHPLADRYYFYLNYTYFEKAKKKAKIRKFFQFFYHKRKCNEFKSISVFGRTIYTGSCSPLECIFSIKNSSDGQYKRLTILGITFKINYNIQNAHFIRDNIKRRIISSVISLFVPRNPKYIMFNAKLGDKEVFIHNTKYLFLHLQNSNTKDFKVCWLCDDKQMRKELIKHGYKNIYPRNSIRGIFYSLRAKYWFYDYFPNDLPQYYIKGAVLINLWHGIPLKHIGFDDENRNAKLGYNTFEPELFEKLRLKDTYIISSGEYEAKCFQTAFKKTSEFIKILGAPRLDVLLSDIKNSTLFMEEDAKNIQEFKNGGKKLLYYVPTFRDTQKPDFSNWLYSDRLKNILKDNNAVLVCKMHPLEKNIPQIDDTNTDIFYIINQSSDIYPLLKYSDCIITDYSSIAFDYLLLNKPILYYLPDLEEYQSTCRGLYVKFEELAAGKFTYTNEELLNSINEFLHNVDDYKKQREELCDKLFKYKDSNNSKRIVEFLRQLNGES